MKMEELLGRLANPAKMALDGLHSDKVEALSKYARTQIAELHGIGPSAMKTIEAAMKERGIAFKDERKSGGMMGGATGYTTIDEYIERFPKHVQKKLSGLRALIKKIVPEAKEKISYKMPAFELHGSLVFFAAFERHIGFYPIPSGMKKFEKELSKYKTGKGSVQFPMDEPLPFELIEKMVRFRVAGNVARFEAKKRRD